MKQKSLIILLTLIFLTLPLHGQEVEVEQTLTQYEFIQNFKWRPSEKATKYEVIIEKLVNDEWIPDVAKKTTGTSILIPLTPGKKRISVVSLNRLGRRGKQTEWTEFVVLGETQPYLYADYLKKSVQWESPVLRINYSEDEKSGEDIASEAGDPEHSFFLKGKNIFLMETKFYMVPVDESSSGGRRFEAYNKLRKTVPLRIARRDFDRPGVVVEYNPDELHSGYYQVYAENPGNQKTFLDILVMANKEPVFDQNQFPYFPNYEVHVLDTEKIKAADGFLKVKGTGFSGETLFSLSPSTSGIPYPFATSKERRKLDLSVSEINTLSQNGDMELSFKVNTEDVPPGYYNLTAENSMGKSTLFLLVRDVGKESKDPEINSISTSKGPKDSLYVELKGSNLVAENVYTLISQRSDYTGLSTRIPLTLSEQSKNGKKIILSCDREKIKEGVYGLLAESSVNSTVKFFEINKNYKSKVTDLSEKEENDLFIRPVNFVPSEDSEVEEESVEELVYTANEFRTKKQYRVLFPYIAVDLHIIHNYWNSKYFDDDMISSVGFNFELLNLNFMHLGLSGEWNSMEEFYSAEAFLNLSTTHQDFRPYLGFGVGVNVFDIDGNGPVKLATEIYQHKVQGTYPHGIYAFANVGVTLGNFLDVRYTMHYSGADQLIGKEFSTKGFNETDPYFYDDITLSARVPLGKLKRIQKIKNHALTITKKGIVSGKDYKLKKDIKKIIFSNGVTEIRDFNDNYMLTYISVPDTVRVIGKDAFKNCYNLKEVILPDGVIEIEDGAFEGCRSMQKIVLPSSIRNVSPSAFSDWEDYQYIVYQWSKDDATKRNLGGLETRPNFTTVYDAMRTPFEKKYVFTGFNGKGSRSVTSSSRFTYDGIEYYKTEFANHVTLGSKDVNYGGFSTGDSMVMSYLKNGDGITFHYIGDGNNYSIVIWSKDMKTRLYYNFYAKKGENEITIPFSHLIYDEYASKRFVKVKKMDIGSFGIETVYDDRYLGKKYSLSVFGFETIMEKKKK